MGRLEKVGAAGLARGPPPASARVGRAAGPHPHPPPLRAASVRRYESWRRRPSLAGAAAALRGTTTTALGNLLRTLHSEKLINTAFRPTMASLYPYTLVLSGEGDDPSPLRQLIPAFRDAYELLCASRLRYRHALQDRIFYQEFRASGQPNLALFYRSYIPPITPEHYTCVGLALELLCRLANLEPRFPGISSCLYLVSSEESIEELEEYVNREPNPRTTEKEHVMVAMHLNIAGRSGVMLLDPGYHVARVITVMADGLYPHTGWFVQSDEPHCRKEYNYTLTADGKYVVWCNRETRNNLEENSLALIYVARPFLSPIEVTERRNLVYNFRSLLARDTKGHLIAGFYLKVECSNQPAVTIFHQNGNSTKRKKVTFEDLLKPEATEEVQSIIHICNQQLGMPEGHLQIILANLAIILADSDFISQLLGINRDIYEMSCNN
ncbi:Uncharacterized protein GBIM_01371 [Gryllus bimaculatus]|nr:Uncharacterized protein GBIM_01371 [Gryllus bimaculatus]